MSNYTNLLKTAREQADERLASKGLTGSSFQSVEENDADRLLISPPQALVSKRKTVNTDSEKEDDFMTKYFGRLREQNRSLVEEASSTRAMTDESGEPVDILNQGDDLVKKAAKNSVPRFDTELSGFKALLNDEEFMRELDELKKEFPTIQNNELFNVIFKESSFNPAAKSEANAVGLLQMMPEVLGEMGLTTEEVLSMEPADQLIVYKGYLKRWGYDGSSSLGILQAAPAYRNSNPDTIIYRKGSKQAKMNPGWQNASGNVTKKSIDNFYRGSN